MTDEAESTVLRVRVAEWEYQCCEDIPSVGQQVRWDVAATRAQPDDPHAIRDVTWVEDLELVRFPGGSASRRLREGDVPDAPVVLYAGWHGDQVDVVMAGVILDVEREADGVVVGVCVQAIVEPTPEDVAAERTRRDRNARTVSVTGPVAAFGGVVPTPAQRFTIDLDDARLRQQLKPREVPRSGTIMGEVRQVSRSEAGPHGGRYFYDIEPGDPPPDELFVALVSDT